MKKEIKTNFLKKTIATMLLFVMVFQFIPNIAIGFTDLEKTKEENIRLEEHIKKEMEKAKEEEPTIVGELKEQRTLNEKQFIRTDGTKVIYEKTGNDKIYYSYDENDNIIGLNKNGIQYYYIKNLQEDIIGILDNSLQQIVSYKYDSWGNIISIKDLNGNEITNKNNIGFKFNGSKRLRTIIN